MRSVAFLLFVFPLPSAFAWAQHPRPAVPQEIQALLEARNFAGAEQALLRELQRSPQWDFGDVILGRMYNQMGRYAEAERAGLAAIRSRESVDGFMVLAIATMRLNRLNESIGWLEKAARRRPDYAEIYRVLGLDYALGGNLSESQKALVRAGQLDPENWETHYLCGRVLYERRLYRDSEKALRRALELNPRSVRAWTALGQTQEFLYDPDGAGVSYRRASEFCGPVSRECAWPLMQLGFLASRRNGHEEAESYFAKSIAARPDWAKPHFYLGKSRAAQGDFRGARAEMETAAHLDATRPEYHYQLARVYRRLGATQQADRQMSLYESLTARPDKQAGRLELTNP